MYFCDSEPGFQHHFFHLVHTIRKHEALMIFNAYFLFSFIFVIYTNELIIIRNMHEMNF